MNTSQNNDALFRELSEKAMKSQIEGDFISFSACHKKMADLLHRENNYYAEVKSRLIAFYFDISGLSISPWVDSINTEAIALAAGKGGFGDSEVKEIYFDSIKICCSENHAMTLKGSYKLLELCMKDQWKKVNRILKELSENKLR